MRSWPGRRTRRRTSRTRWPNTSAYRGRSCRRAPSWHTARSCAAPGAAPTRARCCGAALERFDALGAAPWADRAAAELRATGETARKRDASTLDQLTPQELQIARLVAEGGRNRDVAARLFLSPKTVEYHLRKVFQKLDIGARADLIRLVSSGDAAQELVGAA